MHSHSHTKGRKLSFMKMYGNNFLAQYFSLFSRIIRFYSLLLTKRAFVNPFLYILLCASAYIFSSLPLLFLHARLCSVLLGTLNHYEKCSQSTKLSSLSFMIPRQHVSNLCVLMLSLCSSLSISCGCVEKK